MSYKLKYKLMRKTFYEIYFILLNKFINYKLIYFYYQTDTYTNELEGQ
jgi:hypothetical protein